MLSTLTAALPIVSQGLQIGGSLAGLFGRGNSGAQSLANANYELSVRQMQNQAALVAEAMRRSTAGTSDSEGNRTSYDPGSNTWYSSLGPGAERVQRSSDNATTLRNTVDVPLAQRANQNRHLLGAISQRYAIPAAADVSNFTPRTAEREFADTSLAAASANNEATRPVLQDTLRSFARTGTAAAPIIDAIGKSSAENMRRAIFESRNNAVAGAGNYNNSMLSALTNKLGALRADGNPAMDYVNGSTQNPLAALTQSIAQRAANAGETAGRGAAYSAYGMNSANEAMRQAIGQQTVDPLPNALVGAGKAIPNLVTAIQNFFNNPGSKGDTPSNILPRTSYDVYGGWRT